MSPKKLSAAFVKSVKIEGKYYDENGLFLQVSSATSKRWIQRIIVQGKRTDIGLGSANLVTLLEARHLAFENRKIARSGGNPLSEKRKMRSIPTFESATLSVFEANKPTWRNEKHANQFLSTLQTYTFPYFGGTSVAEVSSSDILRALSPIWTTKGETARRVRQRIGMIMKWAIAQGWRLDNPAEAVVQALPKQDRTQKHRKSLPYTEIQSFLSHLNSSNASLSTKHALLFLMHTAARSGEARHAVWSEIDLQTAEWTIPAQKMKANKLHRIPLSLEVIKILTTVPRHPGTDLLFPGSTGSKPLSDMTLSKLVKELGFDVDVHGFRTTFRTWAQEQTSYSREVVEKALAHSIKNKAEAAYARSDLFQKRRQLMHDWSDYIIKGGA